ncbi:MAG: esterase-like activity of phytase family protein [Mangrovicoccus sp.]|nr:esterase-like activity of phytase family protein [Mangrovicoccus sp.]
MLLRTTAIFAALAPMAALAPLAAPAQEMVAATLAGHAVIPANTMSAPPTDAPRAMWVSGKFTGPARNETPMSDMRPSGLALPFLGQPFQGISGYAATRTDDGALIALIDNGFGSKLNSPDAMLSYVIQRPDFETGEIAIEDRIWLRDPNGVVPFTIKNEASDSRYLTGGDFDLESIQVIGDELWIGEEFGPYLIRATLDGVLTGVFPTMMGETELRSPDHPALRVPAQAGVDFTVPRSGGYEGMALSPQGTLWAMLEKPLIAESGEAEGAFLRVLEFDPVAANWTGQSFKFALTDGAVAIGDFNFIDDTRALVIERDGGQGDPSLACPEGQTEGCFERPAQVKRITLIDTAEIDDDGFVARLKQIDLMNIADPNGLAAMETSADRDLDGVFTFPFVTIESVIRDGDEHIIVGNDNNLPFSIGRKLGQADSNEKIRLHVPELLAAN